MDVIGRTRDASLRALWMVPAYTEIGRTEVTWMPRWSTGSTQPSVNIHNFGTYWVRVTNFCGTVSDTIAIKDLVGVQSLNELGYTLYPNPNSGSFHLKGGDRNIELSVTNQLGQEIPYSRMDLNGEVFIQLSNPLPGIYHLNAILGDQTIFSRIMVQ